MFGNQRQQAGGQYQDNQNSNGPKLKIAPGELLDLLLNVVRASQHGGWVMRSSLDSDIAPPEARMDFPRLKLVLRVCTPMEVRNEQ